MHAILKKAALAAALATASLSAHAVETKISVYADVDPTLALLRDDGSALPDAVTLTHDPLRGLVPSTQHVRIHSNDEKADIEAKIGGAFALVNGDGKVTVPMTVSLNRRALAESPIEFKAADLFTGAGSTPGASISMPLTIAQTTPAPITTKGAYTGIVNIVLNQKATTP
ncbi:giant cable pilus fimbrial subunit [Stenotrophomonas maltophilia]|uniref:Giant cable pilus fimbrial subunit n=1 Tax=Stenotrophomonas maltophilia TaxID=40324 RepID=A0AAX1ICD1_STEMA|nr:MULTISPECIES: CS1 type fimbrial major subunit [Stenotrophomonas maltophilia group]MCF3497213.1 fimbrial protein [Stenotrophomonas maltophilia]MDQ4679306.1 CS1 type fimbrial major subunit [Stenotrophomonas maltophilia group sp. RNC7]PSD18009.1 fimbrial protein [Stenotrophomonas maltophilia]QGL81722.1 fimbrial protein [Stenotrophomonas maltophilia]QNG78000.1 giant cable pilus fimbrial subunit [Stenotrophomonas maltophilia]